MFKVYKNFYFPNAPIIQIKNNQQQNKILKDKVYISIIEFHSTQKDQFHHPPEEILMLW